MTSVSDLVFPDPRQSGSFIITAASFHYSRERAVIAAGSGRLGHGTVLGRITANGKYAPSPDAASDGSQNACAILWEDVDATSDDVAVSVVARNCDVFAGLLSYHASVDSADKLAAKESQLLANAEINVRAIDDPEARSENMLRMMLGW